MKLKYLCTSFSNSLAQMSVNENGKYKVYGASGFVGYIDEFGSDVPYLGIVKDGAGVGRIQEYESYSSLLGTLAYIIPNTKADIKWLKYVIQNMELGKDVGLTTIPHIYFSEYGNREVRYVELKEQKKISTYLDNQCAHIANIIEKTKASIEEYKKLRQAVITQAVTKGVRGDRPMKDSGYEWISEVPAEWSLIPSKYLFGNSDARKQPDDVQLTASQKHGIISQQEYMELENAKIVFANQGIENWKHVEPNDFIISLRSFQGGLELSEVTGCITWHYIVMKALKQVNYRYFKWLFKSKIYITALQRTCNYIRDGQDLRYSNFIQVPLFEPSLEEQQEISEYLDKKTTEIDTLITKKEQFLTELESYKKSMIYEYVTGKKEVPQA